MSGLVPVTAVRLILVRHGEAGGNREMRYLGSSDVRLTERGRAQAEQLARTLVAFRLDAIYTSPLLRAAETAHIVSREAGHAPRVEPDLRESAYGAWEGLTRAEALASAPELLRRWETDPDVAPPDGGESLRATQRRVVSCVEAFAARHPGATLALVSHVGPIKSLVCQALGLGPEGARRMWLDPATITVLDWPVTPGQPAALRLYNAFAHLAEGVRWLPRDER